MNVNAAAEKTSLPLNPIANSPTFAKVKQGILFWTLLPAALLFLNCALTFLKPCFFSIYLPLIMLPTAAATVRFRTWGLSGSYLAIFALVLFFASSFDQSDRLWQMGILFSLALNLFILLLGIEECEGSIDLLGHASDQINSAEQKLMLAVNRAEIKEKELKDEIERLKQEAELRKIEKANLAKQMELIQSEIEWLTSHKDAFIEESKSARTSAAQYQQLLEECKAQFHELETASQTELAAVRQELEQEKKTIAQQQINSVELERLLQLEITTLTSQKEISQQRICSLEADVQQVHANFALSQESIITFQQRPVALQTADLEELTHLKQDLAKAEGINKQLRQQFDEKTQILAQARKDLFALEGQLFTLEQENTQLKTLPTNEDLSALEKHLTMLSLELESHESEIRCLEELVYGP